MVLLSYGIPRSDNDFEKFKASYAYAIFYSIGN